MPNEIFQIKISLLDINPLIWRSIAVKGDITLDKLHKIIQTVMDWNDYHMHEFRSKDAVYAVPDPEFGANDAINERRTKLNQVIDEPKRQFLYTYDFGDDWRHSLYVEKILAPEPDVKYPICLGGERACPPEDCGGPPGYDNFLKAIGNPSHEQHEDMLEWIGGEYDPEWFDLSETNQALGDAFNLKRTK